jgi:DNA-binding NarL/FixJ family response regulator
MSKIGTVTVVVGHFDPLSVVGLESLLTEDRQIRILSSNLEDAALEAAVTRQKPQVVILGETIHYGLLARLKASGPVKGVLVLSRYPTVLGGTLLLAAGATCLARSSSGADLLAAVHLAASGEPRFVSADGAWVAPSTPGEGLLTPR